MAFIAPQVSRRRPTTLRDGKWGFLEELFQGLAGGGMSLLERRDRLAREAREDERAERQVAALEAATETDRDRFDLSRQQTEDERTRQELQAGRALLEKMVGTGHVGGLEQMLEGLGSVDAFGRSRSSDAMLGSPSADQVSGPGDYLVAQDTEPLGSVDEMLRHYGMRLPTGAAEQARGIADAIGESFRHMDDSVAEPGQPRSGIEALAFEHAFPETHPYVARTGQEDIWLPEGQQGPVMSNISETLKELEASGLADELRPLQETLTRQADYLTPLQLSQKTAAEAQARYFDRLPQEARAGTGGVSEFDRIWELIIRRFGPDDIEKPEVVDHGRVPRMPYSVSEDAVSGGIFGDKLVPRKIAAVEMYKHLLTGLNEISQEREIIKADSKWRPGLEEDLPEYVLPDLASPEELDAEQNQIMRLMAAMQELGGYSDQEWLAALEAAGATDLKSYEEPSWLDKISGFFVGQSPNDGEVNTWR